MAVSRSMLKNLGKSIAYSSVDVLTKLAPNTTDMLRGARNGVDYTRDVIRTQASKLRIQQTQFDRSTINRQARLFLQDAWNDIKQGNLALGDLSDQSMDDWDKFMDDVNSPGSSSITSFSDTQFNDNDANNNDQSGRMSAAATSATLISSDRRTLQGLQQLAKVTGSTTMKAAQFQTEQITNALFVQMTAQNEHFIQIEKKLDSINANLVQLVKFQSESQGVTNQAMMNFMDQMTRWMRDQDKIQANRSRRSPRSYKSAAEKFLSSNRFDMSEYGKVIKDNIDASPLGIALSMGSMLSPDMLMMAMGGGFGGKIQPQKFLLNALLTALIPKGARRSISRGDNQIGTMAKTMLTRLGARKYSMDSGGLGSTILGLLGSVFGIDTNLRRTINLGHYKKDDMNWNGEAQKALVQVIPKELAEIKAALTGKDARYFDAGTGTYMDRKQIKRNTKVRFQNAIENPFANIFNNEFSSNPDDRRNKMLWASMSDDFQKQVEAIINEAIMNNEGMSTELNKALDKAIGKGIKDAGGTKFDTQRMVMKLADAVNESRSNLANVIEELQAQNSAFTQIAADMADDYGRIKFKDLQDFIGGSAVDLREATGGRYAANGRRFDQMTAEERRAYEASFNTARRSRDKVKGMKNSRNRFVRGAGKVIETVDDYRTGARQNRYSRSVTGAVDNASHAVYRATMLGENPLRRGSRNTQDVDWDQFDQDNGIGPTPPPTGGTQRVRRATTSMSDTAPTGGTPDQEAPQNKGDRASVLKRAGGIVNQAVAKINSKAQGTPEETATIENAENTDEMKKTLNEAFGLKGYMRKIFDSPVMKTIAEKFKKSAIGKAVGEKLEGAKKFTGGVLKDGFKDLGNRYLNLMKTAFGFTVDEDGKIDQSATPTSGSAAEAIQDSAQEIKDTTETITGSDGKKDAKKQAQDQIGKILKSFSSFMKKNAPKGIMGAAIGGAIPILAGGKMGLIGGLFMPGGAIGGAILGASLGLLSKTEAFQKFMFGPEDENGERSGGLIKKEMVDKFKKALPTLGVGATAGVILKLLSSATGIGGGLAGGVAGFIPNMLLPGGVLGAAIMGSAAAFALKNEKVQDIIFGAKDEDGTRKGAILSGAYNKFTALLKGEAFKGQAGDKGGKQSLFKRVIKGLGAAGAGALGATALSQMGLLGSTLTFGGPIGTAIAGAALGILGTSEKFQQYVYGTKSEDGKRKKDGLLSRFTTMLQLNLVEPVSQYFKTTTEQFAWWAKEKIEVPFRLAFGPVIDSFKDLRDSMKDAATGAIKKGGDFIGKKIEKILSPIGSFFMKYILKPLGSAAGGLLKTGLFAGASIAGAPFQILSTLLSPVRRKQQKKFGTFLKDNKEQNLQQYWENTGRTGAAEQFFDRLQYNAATLPIVGNLFRGSDVIGDVAEDIYGDPTGQNRNSLNWLNAKRDRKTYRQERKNLRKEDKEWRKLSKVRQQISKSVGNNADAEFSPIEFDNWQKKLKKMGVDIQDADELRKFTFDYNGWKNPKPDKAAEQQSQMAKDTGEIKGLVEKAVGYLASIADTNKANVDIQTGTVTDTEDIETNDVAEEIDSDKVEEIQKQKNASTVNAFSGLINKIFKRQKKEANDAVVRGNTSGNATDEEGTAEQMVEDAGVGESDNDQSGANTNSEGKTGILSTVLGGIGKVLTSKTGLAALASAAVLAVIGNDEMRKIIGDGIGNALGSAKDWLLTKLGFQKDPTGQDTSREADIDGDGETETIANQNVIRDTASILVKGKKGVTTAVNTLSHMPVIGTAVKAGKTVAKGATKAVKTAASTASKVWSGTKKVASVAKKSATTDTGILSKALSWIQTALDKLASTKFGKAMSGFLTPLSKFFDDIIAKVAKNGSKISDLLAKLSTKVSSLAGSIGKVLAGLNVVMIAGSAIDGALNPERLFMIDKKYVDAKMRVIATIFNALTSTAVGAVIDLVSEIVNVILGVDFIQSLACIVYYAVSNDEDDKKMENALKEFKQETANYNEANNTNISVDAYNDLKNKGLAGSAVNWAKNLFGKGDKTDYSQYEVGNYKSTGNGVGATGYGTQTQRLKGNGMQTDPRWANMNLGMFPNGSLSTMATGGCGPTALSNAANYLGLGANPGMVGKFALNNGYISQGGANDALFDEGAPKMGLSTKKVSSDSDIANSLRRGKPVIMAGKSSGYGSKTPYTKAGHIITATKLNADGTVTVQDPMRGVGKYKLSDLQSKMTAGWSVDKSTRKGSRGYGPRRARGYGLFDAIGNVLSAGASSALTGAASKLGLSNFLESASGATDTSSNGTDSYYAATGTTNINLQGNTQAEQIWNYLIGQGYTPEAAAGIMGCWQIESSNRSDRVEGDYLKNFPGFQSVLASNQALNNYTTSFLFPAYERSNISINKNGYKGTDGNYYPGIGLAQWTGSRGYNLFKFSRDNGIDWRNLDTQLAFFNQEIQQRGVKDIFNSATSAADGAHKVLDYYEMYKGYGAKAPSALKKRQDAANSIYSQYKNKTGASTSKTAVGNGRGARGYGLFDAIGNVLSAGASSALTGAASSLGLSNFLNTSSTGDTSGTTGDASFGGSVGSFTPATGSEGQKAVVNKMSSIQGKIKYSLKSGEQDPDRGTASCASTVGWAYRKALGVNNMSASSTTQSKDSRFSTIWTNDGSPLDKSMLQPGDILYQNWDRTSNNGTMQHTEMYAGNGQDLSHGGKPEYGPVFKDLDDYRIKHTMMVRRYNGFLAGTGTSAGNGIGYGLGPNDYGEDDPFNGSMNLSASGQIGGTDRRPTSYSRGYGSAFNSTAGMETRLDTIIGLMRQIINKGNAVANNVTNNINYGTGDKNVSVNPSAVVIKETDRTSQIGKHDASNEYLRAQHRRLATAQHD